jgi:hypothetical protein
VRGFLLPPLTEIGWERIMRRVRKLEGEPRKVAERLADHAMLMQRQRDEAIREVEGTRACYASEARYSRHLANRLDEVFGLLTEEQRAEMQRRDAGREPFRFAS